MVEETDKKFIATQVIGKMQMEPDFLATFKSDPEAAVKSVSEEIGKKLQPTEVKEIKAKVEEKALPVPFLTDPEMKKLVDDINNQGK